MDCLFENGLISNDKAPTSSQNRLGNTQVQPKDKNSTLSLKSGFKILSPEVIEVLLPIVTVSEANGGAKKAVKRSGKTVYKSEHWSERATRHKRQKGTIYLFLRPHQHLLKLPCHIILTRYAPRKLDKFDNLPGSLKWIVDALCELITGDTRPGRADDNDDISITCNQVISKEYFINIRIEMI